MDGKVTWKNDLVFEALGDSGKAFLFDSASGPERLGPGPMEVVALSLAGCSAMDVISILQKKQQDVIAFEVRVHSDRSRDYPKVYTRATLEYRVTGRKVDETAVLRAIELSVEKYCPVHAMLSLAFPIDLTYVVLEDEGEGNSRVVAEGNYMPVGEE
ncbi:MAG: OsmC family protein [Chloroflexota bacterium]